VRAFDAHNNAGASVSPLWQVSLFEKPHRDAAGVTTVSSNPDIGCSDLVSPC
jgi:hypothetical protein